MSACAFADVRAAEPDLVRECLSCPSAPPKPMPFYAKTLREQVVCTVRDVGCFPAPPGDDGRRGQPFWSWRSRIEQIVRPGSVDAGMQQFEINLVEWRKRWLPGLERDGVVVRVSWSGDRASGFDVEPADVERNLVARGRPVR
jgi:Protein of unknown function (DUF2750)